MVKSAIRHRRCGLATATVLDECIVPDIGLGAPPWQASRSSNLYSYASYLVVGGTAERFRRKVAGKRAATIMAWLRERP